MASAMRDAHIFISGLTGLLFYYDVEKVDVLFFGQKCVYLVELAQIGFNITMYSQEQPK